jgi:hypothetical protein
VDCGLGVTRGLLDQHVDLRTLETGDHHASAFRPLS